MLKVHYFFGINEVRYRALAALVDNEDSAVLPDLGLPGSEKVRLFFAFGLSEVTMTGFPFRLVTGYPTLSYYSGAMGRDIPEQTLLYGWVTLLHLLGHSSTDIRHHIRMYEPRHAKWYDRVLLEFQGVWPVQAADLPRPEAT